MKGFHHRRRALTPRAIREPNRSAVVSLRYGIRAVREPGMATARVSRLAKVEVKDGTVVRFSPPEHENRSFTQADYE